MFFWERKTLPVVTPFYSKKIFKYAHAFIACALLMAFAAAMVFSPPPLVYLLFVPLLTRLAALDFQYHVLANVYVLPLGIVGLVVAMMQGAALASSIGILGGLFIGLLANFLLRVLTGKTGGLGGGDIKFLGAAGAWLGIGLLPVVLWLGLAFILPTLIFRSKGRAEIPFGPALIGAFWLTLLFKNAAAGLILALPLPI